MRKIPLQKAPDDEKMTKPGGKKTAKNKIPSKTTKKNYASH
jgi:hypothetical protein